MSEDTPTTGEVEDGYAYNEWDTDAEEEVPRREAFDRWYAAEVIRAKTVTAEQVEAAAESMREQSPDSAPDWFDWVWHRYARAAFRAAGFYVMEADDEQG